MSTVWVEQPAAAPVRTPGRRTAGASRRIVLHVTTDAANLYFLRGQLKRLQERGWEAHALSAPGADLHAFAHEEAVQVHTAPLQRSIAPLRDLRALRQVMRVIREVRPDIVHGHTPKASLIGMLAATLCRVPVRIYQVRGLPLETATGLRRALLRVTERITSWLADRVLFDSASLERVFLRERLCRAEKCVTLLGGLGNGVDARGRFDPARITARTRVRLRQRLGVQADAPIVGYVGRLARDKGIAELAAAWPLVRGRHPTAHLLLIGNVDEREPAPPHVFAALRADPSVHFVGHVADVAPWYASINVVVLPTYREGLPNVLLEAAAMARPVVATHVTGCVDAVRDQETGLLIEPRSVSRLADAIDRYLSQPVLARRHGNTGRARVLRDFRQEPLWDACAAEYGRLLDARRGPASVMKRRAGSLEEAGQIARRAFDLAGATIALVGLAPVVATIALLVRVTLGSPVLFRQQRTGRFGRPFTLHKFRTMRIAFDAHGDALPDEARITRVGAWLRRTSLDELPELWDVLRGRMSLVGPRPLVADYQALYNERQARRHDVRPGITGWAQVNGRNGVPWEDRFELDVWYVENASPMLDLRILGQTIPAVLSGRGVTPPGRAFMEPFNGVCT